MHSRSFRWNNCMHGQVVRLSCDCPIVRMGYKWNPNYLLTLLTLSIDKHTSHCLSEITGMFLSARDDTVAIEFHLYPVFTIGWCHNYKIDRTKKFTKNRNSKVQQNNKVLSKEVLAYRIDYCPAVELRSLHSLFIHSSFSKNNKKKQKIQIPYWNTSMHFEFKRK